MAMGRHPAVYNKAALGGVLVAATTEATPPLQQLPAAEGRNLCMMATELTPPLAFPRPVPGQDGTYDLGDSHEDKVRRFKVRTHVLTHYKLPDAMFQDCPYCGGLYGTA